MKQKIWKRSVCTLLALFLCVSTLLPVAFATDEAETVEEITESVEAIEIVREDTPAEADDTPAADESAADEPDDPAEPADDPAESVEAPADDTDTDAPETTVTAEKDEATEPAESDPATTEKKIEEASENDSDDAPSIIKKEKAKLSATSAGNATIEQKVGSGLLGANYVTRSDIQALFGNPSGSNNFFGFAPSGGSINYLSTALSTCGISNGDYVAYWTTSYSGTFIKTPKWENATTISVKVRLYYTGTLSAAGHEDGCVLLNDEETSGSVKLYTDTQYTVSAKEIEDYVYSITGAEEGVAFTPSSDMTITANYIKAEFATVTVVENEGGSTAIKVGDQTVGDKVQAGESFTVEPAPDTANDYYVESVVITKDGEEIEGLTVGPVADGEAYIVTVTYAQATLSLADCQVNIIDIEKGNYGALESAILANASLTPAEFADEATAEVKYHAGLLVGYQPLSYGSGLTTHSFGEGSMIGSVEIGNTETVRVTYTIPSRNLTLTAEATVTVADLRIPTTISGAGVTITYGDDLKEALLPQLTVIGDDGATVSFNADEITVDPEKPDVKLLQYQDVTVRFAGNDEYAASEGSVSIYVRQADSFINVKSETITYGQTPALEIDTDPGDLDIIRVIGGIDGDATGFVSIDIPQSTKEKMKIKVGGTTVVDFYEMLSNGMEDGITLSELRELITSLSELAKIPLVAEALAASGFDVESLQSVLDIITTLPELDVNAKITLGNPPKNAGIYLVSAVSADLNYRLSADVGYLAILPKTTSETDTVELRFTAELPGALGVMSYNDAQTFTFGGGLYVNDALTESTHVHALYAGTSSQGEIEIQSNEPIREPGVYTETIYILGGNYYATPIIRTYTVERKATDLKLDDDTVVYDGKIHTLTAYTDDDVDLKGNVVYTYMGNGYIGNIPPVFAGTYTVTALYTGDATHKPAAISATLTIKKAEATVTATCVDSVVYGDVSEDDHSALELGYEIEGVLKGEYLGGVWVYVAENESFPHVGDYQTGISFRQVNMNYKVTLVQADFTITPRPVTVTIDTVSKAFGTKDPKLTCSTDNLAFEDALDVTLWRAEGEEIGDYPIFSSITANPDYEIKVKGKYVSPIKPEDEDLAGTGADSEYGLFRIKAREIIVKVDDASKDVGEDDPEIEFTVTDTDGNPLDPDEVGVKLTREPGEKPGEYTIKVTVTNENYKLNESKSSGAKLIIEEPATEETEKPDPQKPTGKSTENESKTKTNPKAPSTGSTGAALAMLITAILALAALLLFRRRQSVSDR